MPGPKASHAHMSTEVGANGRKVESYAEKVALMWCTSGMKVAQIGVEVDDGG